MHSLTKDSTVTGVLRYSNIVDFITLVSILTKFCITFHLYFLYSYTTSFCSIIFFPELSDWDDWSARAINGKHAKSMITINGFIRFI